MFEYPKQEKSQQIPTLVDLLSSETDLMSNYLLQVQKAISINETSPDFIRPPDQTVLTYIGVARASHIIALEHVIYLANLYRQALDDSLPKP
jgi:hypothetical protein